MAHLAISGGIPGSSRLLFSALTCAEARGREFIAEAAVLVPINNKRSANDLAQGYCALESEVADLIQNANEFDQRWTVIWARKPSWAGEHLLRGPFTLPGLSDFVRYSALRNRQLTQMLNYLEGGSNRPVQYVEHAARADQRAAEEARAA